MTFRGRELAEYLWHVAVAEATLIALFCLIFVAWYSRHDWRATALGRNLMHFTGIIGATFGLTALFAWLDILGIAPLGKNGRIVLVVFVYTVTLVLVVQRVLVAYWTQREWYFAVRKAAARIARDYGSEGEVRIMGTQKRREPVLITLAVLAGMDFIIGSASLANLLSHDAIGFLQMVMTGVSIAVAFYLRGEVVPFRNVGAFVSQETGEMKAGPAAPQPTGKEVEIVTAGRADE